MTQKDIIVRDLTLSQESTCNLQDLYITIKKWFALKKYEVIEKEHEEKDKGNDAKDIVIKWQAEKAIDPYLKFIIEVKLSMTDQKVVLVEEKGKKVKMSQGEVKITFLSYIQRDYTADYERKPIRKFLREAYDAFVLKKKLQDYGKELSEETYALNTELKSFLNLYGLH